MVGFWNTEHKHEHSKELKEIILSNINVRNNVIKKGSSQHTYLEDYSSKFNQSSVSDSDASRDSKQNADFQENMESVHYKKKVGFTIKGKFKLVGVLFGITIYSLVWFAVLSSIVSAYAYSTLIGPFINFARGSASAILGLSTLLLLLVNYSLMTFLRGYCCKHNFLLIDKKILFH